MSNGPGPQSQAVPPLIGGIPVDYGPRADDKRQVAVKGSTLKTEVEEAPPSRHLWVGNVAQEVSEAYIAEKFVQFGELESATVYPQRNYAFVNFKNERDAVNAKNKLQGSVLAGLRIRIEFAKGAKPSRHLWVGGICPTVKKEQIEAEVKKFGPVEDFTFMHDRRSALVHFAKLDDAVAAVEALNRKRIGNEELRVDFGRSQPTKESKDDRLGGIHRSHSGQLESFRGPPDSLRNLPDARGPLETFQAGLASRSSFPSFGGGKADKDGDASEILWVGFPLQTKVDEDRLIRAFIPYGEIERVKTFPGRTYAFVQFRTVAEAIRAKNALEGKLFNDPRVNIRFSNSEIGPVDNAKGGLLPPPARHEGTMFSDDIFKTGSILGHQMLPPGDRHVSSNGRPLSPALQLVPDFTPSGVLAVGVGGRGRGSNTGLGRGMGRGLGPGSGGLIVQDKTIDSSYGGRGTTPFVHAAGQAVRPNRPFNDDLDLPDEDIFNRESKRVRLGGGFPQPPAENPVMSPRFDKQRLMPPNARHLGPSPDGSLGPYANGPGPRLNSVPVPFDGPRPLNMVPGSGATGAPPALSHSIGINVGLKRSNVSSEGRLGVINEGWKWQGLVAKGGTPVCHARCFPVGKGIDIDLPDVINCTARTDLDMLAKHVYQAGDYGVVFFVPDGDVDVTPYQDFMRYLGEKHRAGVAKLSNGSTLFLVPPSEFSEGVLKVPGKNCLFGVVLKFQQQSATYMQAPPPQQQQPLTGFQQKMPYLEPPPQDLAVLARVADQALQPGQGVSMLTGTSQLIPAHLANIPLTPELIASLTALLPQRSLATLPSSVIAGPSSVASGVNVVDATMGRTPSLGSLGSLINLTASASMNESFSTSQNNPPLPSQLWPYSQQDQSAPSRGSFVAQSSGGSTLPPLEPSPRLQPQPPSQPQLQPPPHAQHQPQPHPQHQHQQQPQSHSHPPLPPLPPPPPQQNPPVQISHLSATQPPNTGMVSGLGQGFSQALATGLLSGPPFTQASGESISGQGFPQQLLSTGSLPMPTQGVSVPQSQGYLGSGSSGQYLQQPRPSLSATVAPQLPADQLAQLTALLTQRQQQPAQQQAAQVLQQHYQQQQPTGTLQQPQTSDVQGQQPPQNQQLFSQQLLFSTMPQGAQPGWGQGGQGVQQQSQPVVQGHGVSWEGALSRSQEHGIISGVEQQQLGSTAQDADQETERQKRFQATLHLAAALLQQMQQPPKNSSGTEQQ